MLLSQETGKDYFFLVTSFPELREHFRFWDIKTNLTVHSDVPEVIKQ